MEVLIEGNQSLYPIIKEWSSLATTNDPNSIPIRINIFSQDEERTDKR